MLNRPIHLGDGAYVSPGSYAGELIVTANHHDPEFATDAVHLDPHAVRSLIEVLSDQVKGREE